MDIPARHRNANRSNTLAIQMDSARIVSSRNCALGLTFYSRIKSRIIILAVINSGIIHKGYNRALALNANLHAAHSARAVAYAGLGRDEDYEKALPILFYMGENVIHMGENGKGLVMKICHNALVSQIQNGVNETSTLASKFGIDILTFAKAISYGGAGNWYLDSKKDVLSKEDYTTAFSIENEHKDVHICLDLAKSCGFSMPGEENAVRVYDKAMEMGIGKEDFCATIKVVRGE